jgi:hypothetical protein
MPDSFAFDPITEPETVSRQVFRVSVDNVTPLWPQVEPIIARVLRGHLTHDTEDVRRLIMGQSAQLWVQYSDGVEAIVVSEFVSYPKGVWLRIWLVGTAEGATMDSAACLASLSQWRDMHGCKGFEAMGRMGWLRRYPELKFVGALMRSGA